MKSKFFTITSYIIFLYLVLFLLDNYFSVTAQKNTVIKNYWLLNKKQSEFENAFLGSSRVLNMMDASIFDGQGSTNSINLGLSGVGYAEQYLIYRLFTEQNKNTIKTLFVEISYFSLITPDSAFSYPFHEYFYFPYIKSDFVYETIQDKSKNKLKCLAWRYLPFIKYAEFNVNFRPFILFNSSYKEGAANNFDKSGNLLLEEQNEKIYSSKQYTNSTMDLKNISYLNKILELAKKNHKNIYLYTAPLNKTFLSYSLKASENYKQALNTIIRKYKLSYFNFEDHKISYEPGNFIDRTHLNKTASIKFSKILRDTIKSLNL